MPPASDVRAGSNPHGAAEPFGAVVRAETAGEESVPVGDVHDVTGPASGRANRTRHDARPGVDVVLRVTDDGRLAGGAGRRMDAHDLLAGDGKHSERIVGAQILFGGKREPGQIRERPHVRRMDAGRIEGLAVVRNVVVRARQAVPKSVELERRQFVPRGALDRFEVDRLVLSSGHEFLRSTPACAAPV